MKPRRLRTFQKIKLLDPGRPLAPQYVPAPPPAEFRDIPGQAAMDFGSDDPDALVDPDD